MALDTSASPPYGLDMFQQVVGVHWGGNDIIVLKITFQGGLPITINGCNFAPGQSFDTSKAITPFGPAPVPVVNPVSQAMLSGLYMWAAQPTGSTALVFINAGLIRKNYKGVCTFYLQTTASKSGTITIPGVPYYCAWAVSAWAPLLQPTNTNFLTNSQYYYFTAGGTSFSTSPNPNYLVNGVPLYQCLGAGPGVGYGPAFFASYGVSYSGETPHNNTFSSLAAAQAWCDALNAVIDQPITGPPINTSVGIVDPTNGALYVYNGPLGPAATLPVFPITLQQPTQTVNISGAQTWSVLFENYTKTLNFPYDANNTPQWSDTPASQVLKSESNGTQLPAYSISVSDPASKLIVSGG